MPSSRDTLRGYCSRLLLAFAASANFGEVQCAEATSIGSAATTSASIAR